MASKNIPEQPFLIIAPLSLVDQWIEEANRFFLPGTFQVIKYNPTTADIPQWFAKGSAWSKLKCDKHMRVIVASASVSTPRHPRSRQC